MSNQESISARDAEDVNRAIERRLASPNATHGAESHSRHVHVTDCLRGGQVSSFCSCNHCCLAVCSRCGAYEGGLTTHCPGERIDFDTTQAVFKTTLDYTTQRGWHLSENGQVHRVPLFQKTETGR